MVIFGVFIFVISYLWAIITFFYSFSLSLNVFHLVETQLWFSCFFILCKRNIIFEFLKSKECFQNQNNPYLTLLNNGWVEGGKNQIASKRLKILLVFVVSKGRIGNFFGFLRQRFCGVERQYPVIPMRQINSDIILQASLKGS